MAAVVLDEGVHIERWGPIPSGAGPQASPASDDVGRLISVLALPGCSEDAVRRANLADTETASRPHDDLSFFSWQRWHLAAPYNVFLDIPEAATAGRRLFSVGPRRRRFGANSSAGFLHFRSSSSHRNPPGIHFVLLSVHWGLRYLTCHLVMWREQVLFCQRRDACAPRSAARPGLTAASSCTPGVVGTKVTYKFENNPPTSAILESTESR
ncbi:hypothetical protein MTO96_029911 [Rhipicephalus appendiculatus]